MSSPRDVVCCDAKRIDKMPDYEQEWRIENARTVLIKLLLYYHTYFSQAVANVIILIDNSNFGNIIFGNMNSLRPGLETPLQRAMARRAGLYYHFQILNAHACSTLLFKPHCTITRCHGAFFHMIDSDYHS